MKSHIYFVHMCASRFDKGRQRHIAREQFVDNIPLQTEAFPMSELHVVLVQVADIPTMAIRCLLHTYKQITSS